MFTVGPYLFSGEELEKQLTVRKAEALAAARKVATGNETGNETGKKTGDETGGGDRSARVRELYDRFKIADTSMHVDRAFFADERSLTDEEAEAIAVPAGDRDSFKAVTIAVPYTGDPRLFTATPTIYSAHQPQAEVGDDALRFTWFLNEVEEFQLENNFKRTIALVERTLEVTQWQAMDFNQTLMADLKAELLAPAS